MASSEWAHKKIAVLGYGVEGQSSVDYFLRHGATVEVHDQKPPTINRYLNRYLI